MKSEVCPMSKPKVGPQALKQDTPLKVNLFGRPLWQKLACCALVAINYSWKKIVGLQCVTNAKTPLRLGIKKKKAMNTNSQKLCSCSTQHPCMWQFWSTTNTNRTSLATWHRWQRGDNSNYITMNCVMTEGKHDLPDVFPLSGAEGNFGHVPGQAELQAVMALSRHWAAHCQRCRHLLSFRRRRAGSCRGKWEREVSTGHRRHLYQTQNYRSHDFAKISNGKNMCRLLNVLLISLYIFIFLLWKGL